jgi:hypothetical protein
MKKEKLYKSAFLVAAIIIILLAVALFRVMYTPKDEGVSYIELEDDELADIDDVELDEEEVTDLEEDVWSTESEELDEVEEVEFVRDENNLNILIVKEGDLVDFPNLEVKDPDGDDVTITFSEPLDENGEWQTQKGDAGTYEVTITISDGDYEVSEKVMIIVESTNTPPVIEIESTFTITETDTIKLTPVVTDADGDPVEISYSGWMTSDTKQTDYGDAGEHEVVITASDGIDETQKTVTIIVESKNRPPQFVNIV